MGIDEGSERAAAAIADCTSCAAASMLRSSENCSVIVAMPSVDTDVIESMPAMVENCFSSGVATAEAIVSGLAPGSCACTWIVGKVDVGQRVHRQQPVGDDAEDQDARSSTSTVITGRRTKISAMFTTARGP
mgnify:CR=1 FL=1